jgi:hypothetical protein
MRICKKIRDRVQKDTKSQLKQHVPYPVPNLAIAALTEDAGQLIGAKSYKLSQTAREHDKPAPEHNSPHGELTGRKPVPLPDPLI